jgi:hypothetical protein
MSIRFLNASRSYDATRRSVCFWGHDATFEITFSVEEDALRLISPQSNRGEAGFLQAFDANRSRIETAATKAYGRSRQSFYRLSAPDF